MIAAARAYGPEVRLPDPVGYLPALERRLQREVPGHPLAPIFLGPDAAEAERISVRAAARSKIVMPTSAKTVALLG
jgi:hypothetical protein